MEEIKENYIKQLESSSEQVLATKKNKRKSSPHFLIIYRKLEYVMSIFNTFITNIGFGGIGEELKTKPSVLSVETFLRQTTKEVLEPMVRLVSKGISRAVSVYIFSVLNFVWSLPDAGNVSRKFFSKTGVDVSRGKLSIQRRGKLRGDCIRSRLASACIR